MADWHIFRASGEPHDGMDRLPPPPPWRSFPDRAGAGPGAYQVGPREVELVNAALYLRRPLLVTGPPGVGKSTLAASVAHQLKLGEVLRWSISSRSTLIEGLYHYDALARLRDANLPRTAVDGAPPPSEDIGRYVRLGPLGTALYPRDRPRVLLIDEIDKSDIDLPNDLLHVFEDGRYEIPELARLARGAEDEGKVLVLPADGRTDADRVPVLGGRVQCRAFPVVIMTSNGEREMPPAFLRRCLQLEIETPPKERLEQIVAAHLDSPDAEEVRKLVDRFDQLRRENKLLATDQLLNAVYLLTGPAGADAAARDALLTAVLRSLGQS